MAERHMIIEMQVYAAAKGRFAEMRNRLLKEAKPRLKHYGIEVLEVFNSVQSEDTLCYLAGSKNLETLQAGWDGFSNDPRWLEIKATSEKNGPLIARKSSVILPDDMAEILMSTNQKKL